MKVILMRLKWGHPIRQIRSVVGYACPKCKLLYINMRKTVKITHFILFCYLLGNIKAKKSNVLAFFSQETIFSYTFLYV